MLFHGERFIRFTGDSKNKCFPFCQLSKLVCHISIALTNEAKIDLEDINELEELYVIDLFSFTSFGLTLECCMFLACLFVHHIPLYLVALFVTL